MESYDECKGYPVYSINITNNFVASGCVGSIPYIFQRLEHTINISTSVKLRLLNTWCSFCRVIARYDVLCMLHETGPWSSHSPKRLLRKLILKLV